MSAVRPRLVTSAVLAEIDHVIERLAASGDEFTAEDVRRLLAGMLSTAIRSRLLRGRARGLVEKAGTRPHGSGEPSVTWRGVFR